MAFPDQAKPSDNPLTSEQLNTILLPEDKWNDNYAKQVVRSDFASAESFRTNAHDWRYRNASELYLAYAGQRFWDGTRVPRSSIGVPVTFMQIESLLPKLVSSITATDSYHFSAENPGDDEQSELSVLAWREMVLKQLDDTQFREQVRRACKCLCTYGNGVLESGVEDKEEEYISFESATQATKMMQVNHPLVGSFAIPSETKQTFSRKITRETKKRPYVRYVSIIDFYVDPNCESSMLQDASFVIKRGYVSAESVKALRKNKDFKIPEDFVLAQLSKSKATANQDVTKLSNELFRYNQWNPSQDYTSDPSQKRLELIEYTTRSRKVWMLGREYVIYNKPNPYGCINYFSAPYADVLDRWHGMGIPDVVEGEQRLQQSIINARVDELSLALHRPMIKKRGVTIPAYQLKTRPGVVIETENPEGDIKYSDVQNITQQAFIEVNASEARTQKITGMTDLAAMGTGSSGGNSANRTAAGINTQSGATQDRVRYLVENLEDQLIEPVVNFVIYLDRKFMDTQTAANWLKIDPRFKDLDPEKVMNLRVVAECRGSKKMAARMGFLQVFPMLAQTVFNPEFLQQMAQVNRKKLNPKTLVDMLMDAVNYAPKAPLFDDMSDEEIQQLNAPPPEAQMKAQMAQAQMESDQKINENNLKTKLVDTMLKKGFDHHGKMAELDDQLLLQQLESQSQGDDGGGESGDSSQG